jgi:ribosomal protein S4
LEVLDRTVVPWLERSSDKFEVTVLNEPLRDHIDVPVNEQQIVELYSK